MLPTAPLQDDGVFWAAWALDETMRRTFVMAIFFARIYHLVWQRVSTGGRPDETPEEACDGKLGLCH